MCIGIPARVLRVEGQEACVDRGDGLVKRAGLVAPEKVRKGDYVLLYANVIVNKIDRRSALETLETMKEMATHAAKEEGMDTREVSRAYDRRMEALARRVAPLAGRRTYSDEGPDLSR